MTLTSPVGNGSAKGVVDLPNWRINTSGTIDLSRSLLLQVLADQKGPSLIPFQLSGPIEKPNVKLDTSKIGGGLRIPGGIRKKLDKVLKNKIWWRATEYSPRHTELAATSATERTRRIQTSKATETKRATSPRAEARRFFKKYSPRFGSVKLAITPYLS